MPAALPALNLIAEPGRRRATLDTAREIERRGFVGISVSSSFGNMSQSVGLALATERIPFATAIAPIYAQSVDEFAQNGAYLHEVSGGRFQFGIGIAHAPAYVRMEVKPGKPLGDIRAFVEKFKSHTEYGPLPPVILATLRKRMIALSAEIAEGLVFANGSRAHTLHSPIKIAEEAAIRRGCHSSHSVVRSARFDEALDFILAAWTNDSFSFDGKYFHRRAGKDSCRISPA